MSTCKMMVEIKSRWWLPVYIKTLTLFCTMVRCEQDYKKVSEFIVKHGIRKKVKTVPLSDQ